ncbi:MAG: hypothetical protein ACR5K4_04420 [Sodalis sp. (in: enterobacteria)]
MHGYKLAKHILYLLEIKDAAPEDERVLYKMLMSTSIRHTLIISVLVN